MKKLKMAFTLIFICITSVLFAQQQIPLTSDTLAVKQKTRVKEYGIGFTNLTSYSLQYRWGNPKVLYRINANIGATGIISTTNSSTYQATPTSSGTSDNNTTLKTPLTLNTGASFSALRIKHIAPKFGFVLGGIAGLTYSYTTSQNTSEQGNQSITNGSSSSQTVTTKTNTQILQPYLGFVLGAYYKFNPSFIIYAEITPNVFYAATQTKTNTSTAYYPTSSDVKTSQLNTNNGNVGLSGLTNSGAMITLAYRITK